MTEQHANTGAGEPVPPSDAAPEEQAESPQPGDAGKAARAPLGEWRGPAFWMACGALVAGLAGAAVVLVQRVAVERDMMAVAATLPQPVIPPQPAATGVSQAAVQPPAAAPLAAVPAKAPALRPSAPLSASHASPVRRHMARRPATSRTAAAPRAKFLGTHAKLSAQARRNRAAIEAKYAEVFKRCPPPGERGAIQCRRDICNGAEGNGPACKAYVRK